MVSDIASRIVVDSRLAGGSDQFREVIERLGREPTPEEARNQLSLLEEN